MSPPSHQRALGPGVGWGGRWWGAEHPSPGQEGNRKGRCGKLPGGQGLSLPFPRSLPVHSCPSRTSPEAGGCVCVQRGSFAITVRLGC